MDDLQKIIHENRVATGGNLERFPESIAIIMDGNGRWAQQKGLPRPLGHREGAKVVRKIITQAASLGLKALSLYSFSHQNWSRPAEEVEALMHLFAEYFKYERETVMKYNVKLQHLGSRENLPDMVLKELDETIRVSANNTGMVLGIALNYGSREEIIRATKNIAADVKAGKIDIDNIDESLMSSQLDTKLMADPDLVIRTSGEMRISNFLLWQISYSEFYVTDTHWPDFSEEELNKAICAYSHRDRRFGGVKADT